MCLGLTCRVVAVEAATAVVDDDGIERDVSLLTLTEPVAAGDWVLVHAGFALARLTPEQVNDARSIRGWTGKDAT